MSCTLVLVPAVLGPQLITTLITALVAGAAVTASGGKLMDNIEETRFINEVTGHQMSNAEVADMLVAREMSKQYENSQTICSQYKTIFKDEKLLIKTISEHGVSNIVNQNGKIYGNLDALQFEFEKDSEGLYEMHITHKGNDELTVVDELNEEYQLNVQEQSYMNIKKNLEKQNLTIDHEEVLEDNSIMLTVNLE